MPKLFAVALLSLGGGAWAAASAAPPPPAAKDPSAKPMLLEQLAAIERDLGAKMLKRPAAGAAPNARLEVEIDLRILARWAMAAACKADGDAQPAAWIRATQFSDATAAIESLLDRAGALSTAQQAAITQLHQFTYTIGDGSPKELDDAARHIATALAALAPGGVDAKSLPLMRPRSAAPASTRASSEVWTPKSATPAQLVDAANKLRVSAAARDQIEQLGKYVRKAEADKSKDLAPALAALDQVIELGKALEANVAVSTEQRPELEAKLAESIAMFLDPRTRAAGTARIESLQQYRQIVGRFVRLSLADAQRAPLAPLFAWANASPETGAKALGAVDKYAALRQRFDARPRTPNPVTAVRKPVEEIEKAFEASSAAFMTTAAELPKPTTTLGAADLDKPLDEMRRSLDVLDRLDQLPRTLDTINAYKPRPFGGIDRRISAAAAGLSAGGAKAAEAAKFLDDFTRLAAVATDLSSLKISDLGPEIDKTYAGGQVAAVDARWKTMISELVNGVANGAEVDSAKLARLAGAKPLLAALQEAARVEMAAQNPGALSRWMDWRVSADDLRSMLAAYGVITSEAAAAFAADTPGSSDKLIKGLAKHRPLMVLAQRVVGCRDQCASMPTGLNGLIASLLTPTENAPFALERFASLCAAMRARCLAAQDEAAAADIVATLNKRIAKDLRLE